MKALFFSFLALGFVSVALADGAPDAPAQAPTPTPSPTASAPTTTNVDCSKAAAGKVTISVVGDALTQEKAAQLAYGCLSKANKNVVSVRKQAIKDSRKGYEDRPEACGQSDDLQALTLKSWNSGRPSMSTNETTQHTYGEIGGEAAVLVREPITCDGMGTGLFGGVVASVSAVIEIQNNEKFDMTDESAPGTQKIEAKLKRIVNLN